MSESAWQSLLADLRNGTFGQGSVAPYDEALRDPLVSLIRMLWDRIPAYAWPSEPEAERVGDLTTYKVEFGLPGTTPLYFSFVKASNRWSLAHVESIRIPLEVPECPASLFPDLDEDTKAFMREEIAVTSQVRILNHLKDEAGWEAALDWMKDGKGYFMAARTWAPHLLPHTAFIMYLCWEQQRLRGSKVTLVSLTDASAAVLMRPISLEVFARSGHLRTQISSSDYWALFRAVWEDRAREAGWDVVIHNEGASDVEPAGVDMGWPSPQLVRFEFRRPTL